MPDLIPFHLPGDSITCVAEGAIVGKQLVMVAGAASGGKVVVSQADAGARAFGVAARSAADGADVLIYRPDGGIFPVTAGDAIDANTPLASDADGKVVPAGSGDYVVAWALDDAADCADAMVELVKATAGDPAAGPAVTGDLPAAAALVVNSGGAAADGTIGAIRNPTDTPATVDALRDDLVATTLADVKAAIAELATNVNEVIADLVTAGIYAD